jgi:hypothetical protein
MVDHQDIPLKFNNGFFLLRDYQPMARQLFINWYKEKAYEKISERVELYAKKRGFVFIILILQMHKKGGAHVRLMEI